MPETGVTTDSARVSGSVEHAECRRWWESDPVEYEDLAKLFFEIDGDPWRSDDFDKVAASLRAVHQNPGDPGSYFDLCAAFNSDQVKEHKAGFSAFCAGIAVATRNDEKKLTASRALVIHAERCPPEIFDDLLNWLTPVIYEVIIEVTAGALLRSGLKLADNALSNLCKRIQSVSPNHAPAVAATQRLPMRDVLKSLDRLLDSLPKREQAALEAQLLSIFQAAGGVAAQPRPRSALHAPKAGHELTRPAVAESAVHYVARAANIPIENAQAIVAATTSKPDEMTAASKKLLRPPTRFISKADLTDDDLNDPAVLQAHIDFANQHKNTNIASLAARDPDEAYKLRKARFVRKCDIDRRHMLGQPRH